MTTVSVQFSLYPLRADHLTPAIEAAWACLRARGLEFQAGSMSTLVTGPAGEVFDALREAFEQQAGRCELVLALTVSNACPAAAPREARP